MRLLKSHGLGNDYLVLHDTTVPDPALVRALCDRHKGPGSDGLLLRESSSDADYGLRIFNPDGSEAEKSGNGIRIFARYLVDHCGAPARFTLQTRGGRVLCDVGPTEVVVDMGHASFKPADVPCRMDVDEVVEQVVQAAGEAFTFTAVGLGNPHCVIFRDEALLDAIRWRRWGPILEVHPLFPNRTNVQFARIKGRQLVDTRIWERGVGPTSASGSSACAVAAAAVKTGRCPHGEIKIRMPGGVLSVLVAEDWSLRLRGPVEEIGWVQVSDAWLASRSGP